MLQAAAAEDGRWGGITFQAADGRVSRIGIADFRDGPNWLSSAISPHDTSYPRHPPSLPCLFLEFRRRNSQQSLHFTDLPLRIGELMIYAIFTDRPHTLPPISSSAGFEAEDYRR